MSPQTWFMLVASALGLACTRSTAGSVSSQATADGDAANEVVAEMVPDASAPDDPGANADGELADDEVGDGPLLTDATTGGPDVPEVDGAGEAGNLDTPDSLPEANAGDAAAADSVSDASVPGTDMDAEADAWFPVKGDAAGDTSSAGSDATDANAGPETSGPCKDIRKRGDVKILQDRCWDPPAHYCSGPEFQSFVFGCKPDFSVCCAFPTSCWPCGWVLCPYVPPGGSLPGDAPAGCPTDWTGWMTLSMPGCAPYIPPKGQEFCWDGVPDEWKTPAFHMDGG